MFNLLVKFKKKSDVLNYLFADILDGQEEPLFLFRKRICHICTDQTLQFAFTVVALPYCQCSLVLVTLISVGAILAVTSNVRITDKNELKITSLL